MSKRGKRGGGGGSDDDELAAAAARLKLQAADDSDDERGGKGRGKAKGKAAPAKKAAAAAAPEEETKRKPGGGAKKGRRRGDDSESDEAAAAPAAAPAAAAGGGKKGGGAKVPAPAPAASAAAADGDDDDGGSDGDAGRDERPSQAQPRPAPGGGGKAPAAAAAAAAPAKKGGKKGKKNRRGDDSDDDSDGGGAGGLLGALPGKLSKAAARKAALLADGSDSDGGAKQKSGGGKKARKPQPQRRTEEEDEEEEEEGEGNGGEQEAPEQQQQQVEEAAAAAAGAAHAVVVDAAVVADSAQQSSAVVEAAAPAPAAASAPAPPEPEPVLAPAAAPAAAAAAGPVDGGAAPAEAAAPTDDSAPVDVDMDWGALKKKKKKARAADAGDEEGGAAGGAGPAAPAPAPASEAADGADAVDGGGDVDGKADKKAKREKKEKKDKKDKRDKAGDGEVSGSGATGEEGVFFGEASMGVGKGDDVLGPKQLPDGTWVGHAGEPVHEDVGRVLLKAARGESLVKAERKVLKHYEDEAASRGPLKAGYVAGAPAKVAGDEYALAAFSLSQAGKVGVEGVDAAADNAKDILINNFTITAHKKELFKNAELKITHGRRYGFVGPNGQGKTTLLKYIAARELAIPARIDVLYVEQEVHADDTPAVQAVLRADKKRAGLLEEEADILSALDAADAAEEAGRSSGMSDGDRAAREDRLAKLYDELAAMKAEASESQARKILSGLGFTPDMQERPTRHFSGGWRMRISLARALFMQPTLLLLDEPTNHLDLNAVIWLEDYLSKWKNTLLIVSHDQDFLTTVVTDIIHLEDKRLYYYKGNYDDFKEMHAQKIEKQQKDWEKQQKDLKAAKTKGMSSKDALDKEKAKAKRAAASKGGDKGGKSKGDDDGGGARVDELITRPKEYTVDFQFDDPPELAPPVLAVSNMSFRYGPKYPWLFQGVNFGIDQSSRVAIVGPNGVGKSTLLNLLIGDLEATEGDVQRNRFLRVGKYSQHFVDVLPMDKTPADYLQSKFPDTVTYQQARNLLGRFGLEGHAHTIPCAQLSGGQKARVVFASLSVEAPHIMVLDEPTNNLDIESIDALAEGIRTFGGGIVLVSHDARLIRHAECRLWVCDHGTCAPYNGEYDDYKGSLMESIQAEEAQLDAVMAARAKAEEEARLAAARERARKLRAVREAAKAAAAAGAGSGAAAPVAE